MFTFQLYRPVFPSLLSDTSLSISCKEFYGCIKVKLNYFIWTGYLNRSWYLLENLKNLTFKNTPVRILAKVILFLCGLSFVMCGERQVSFCSITSSNFPAESPIPHLWSLVISQLGNHGKVKTFWRKMNSTLPAWFFRRFSIKRNIKLPGYFKAELPNFSWLPMRNSASLSHESAQPGYKFKVHFIFC